MITLFLLAAMASTLAYAIYVWRNPPAHARRGPLYFVGIVLAMTSLITAVVLARTAPTGMEGLGNIVLSGMLLSFVTVPVTLGLIVIEARVRAVRHRDRAGQKRF